MCGFCGVLTLSGEPVELEVLRQMGATLAHRGPNGEGWHWPAPAGRAHIGFVHRRLKIIDLSDAGAQPMTNEDGTIWLVFNGEIYNYRDLRPRLIARGHRFRSETDTEVLLHLYEERGAECLEALEGMFAFALWDARREQLLLARDRLGKKPLFYHHSGTGVVFASEIKALLRHPAVPAEVDPQALPLYFLHGYVPAPRTLYREIAQLPPAHGLLVDGSGHVRTWQYWEPPFVPRGAGNGVAVGTDEQVCEQLRALMTEAVRKRLSADVPLGAFLSGGVDSTIVVGLMARLIRGRVKTFSIGFAGDRRYDETAYARMAAKAFQTDHTEFIVEPQAFEHLDQLIWYHDGPFGDSSAIPTYLLSQLTRQHVTVALTGDGGDELFAGYERFFAVLLADRIPPLMSRLANRLLGPLPESTSRSHWLTRARRFFRYAGEPTAVRLAGWAGCFGDDLTCLLRSELLQELHGLELPYPEALLARAEQLSPLNRLLYLNLTTYLPGDLLVKADRATMACGLEARSPLLDDHLVEFAARLPDRFKMRAGQRKYIMKRAFADLLPEAIARRGKMGFGVPLASWFRGELRSALVDIVGSPSARYRAYLNGAYVQRLITEHLQGRRDHAHRLWAVLTFERWLQLVAGWAAQPSPVSR